jgi:hypothetical protein
MTEERIPYLETAQWLDLRFDDGKHTGVRVRLGTTIIEVKRDGRKTLVDIAECARPEVVHQRDKSHTNTIDK